MLAQPDWGCESAPDNRLDHTVRAAAPRRKESAVVTRLLFATMMGAILLLPACQRDPGRDEEPLTDPLHRPDSASAPSDIIPIGQWPWITSSVVTSMARWIDR